VSELLQLLLSEKGRAANGLITVVLLVAIYCRQTEHDKRLAVIEDRLTRPAQIAHLDFPATAAAWRRSK
jgi:hypothetical protein